MKTIILATLSIIGVAVIGLSAHKIMEQESQITDLELKNKELLNRNRILEKQLLRERTRQDDLYVGKYCPVCRSDSIRRIKYGIEGVSCVVYNWHKRFLCKECRYMWGIEVKLMDMDNERVRIEDPIDSNK